MRHIFIYLTMVLLLAQQAVHAQSTSTTPSPRLNVVFILADDLGWGELGCYGQQKIPTPHLDQLAKSGMRFTQHYSGAPVCAPSRCVLMTGQHLGHAQIRGNQQAKVKFPEFNEGQYPISAQTVTIAKLFQQAGYKTAAFGKWGLGPVGSTGDPNRQGFDLFMGYNCQAVAHSFYPAKIWKNEQQLTINTKPIPGHQKPAAGPINNQLYQGEQYTPDILTKHAVEFIEQQREQPFFLYLPFIEPHVAMHPPLERVNKFPAEWDTVEYRGENGYLPHSRPRAAYAAMISELDTYVGQVLAALDKAKLSERTLVIFTSDNGTTHAGKPDSPFHIGGADPKFFNSTAGLRGYKGSVFEGGLRVPMIARCPGLVPNGKVSDWPSYFADWLPTLAAATKLTTPNDLDGQSIWPTLTGQPQPARNKPMLWVFPEYTGQVAIRLGNYKVLRQGLKTKQPGPWQVYDLSVDPAEEKNLASDKPELIAQALQILRAETNENEIFPLKIVD
jgi:arylsulfatase A